MAGAPLIGISGRSKTGREIAIQPEILGDLQVDLYFRDYARGVIGAGGLPVFLPSDADPASFAEHLDGLVLSGGADIEPARYGQVPNADLFTPEPDRDAFEIALLDGAEAAGLPVLGICRGVQVMNVHGGGTLHQHVAAHACFDQPTWSQAHKVRFSAGSLAESLYGSAIEVNSLHHQTLDVVADGYEVTGKSDDGEIEALEHLGLPWLGVQWHPEMMSDRDRDPSFAWLIRAAKSRSA